MKNIWIDPTKEDAKLIDKATLTDFRRSFAKKIDNTMYINDAFDILENLMYENSNYNKKDIELSKKLINFLENSNNGENKLHKTELFYKYQYLLIPVNLKINKQQLLEKLQILIDPDPYYQAVSPELIDLLQDSLKQYFYEGININGKLKSFDDLPKTIQQKINFSTNVIFKYKFKLDLSSVFNNNTENLNILFKNNGLDNIIKDRPNLKFILCFDFNIPRNCYLLIKDKNNMGIKLDFDFIIWSGLTYEKILRNY